MINFPSCLVCGDNAWTIVYKGQIRAGTFGSFIESEVCRCSTCGVDRLAESACLESEAYKSSKYRNIISQDHNPDNHFAIHDELARFTLETLWPKSLRNLTVADIGCGAGALLDHLSGVSGTILAVEPSIYWTESLESRGYHWYGDTKEAIKHWAGKVDLIVSTQVIEHVENPLEFLIDIKNLLKPGGVVVVSTPNRRDVLMELLPDLFPAFFYRVQHRWAFDADSLRYVFKQSGLMVDEIRHVHRYGLANTMHWLKEGKPFGRSPMKTLDATIDSHWQAWLQSTGKSDNLYVVARLDEKITSHD
jgi:SAM-dependent methyltransferase